MIFERNITEEACYLINNECTIRQLASVFGLSKSTIQRDITKHLKEIDLALYQSARKILDKNLKERNIRGGMATKARYQKLKGN